MHFEFELDFNADTRHFLYLTSTGSSFRLDGDLGEDIRDDGCDWDEMELKSCADCKKWFGEGDVDKVFFLLAEPELLIS